MNKIKAMNTIKTLKGLVKEGHKSIAEKKSHKNCTTEIVFILDRSGSMQALAEDTIGGFNSTIKNQKKEAGRAYVSTLLFDTKLNWFHDRLPIGNVRPLTEKDYMPGGCTALLDALGESISHIENIHKYARSEDVPQRTMFIIMTDGLENASTTYTKSDIKGMVERKQKKSGWEFIFLGANMDAVAEACSIGIRRDRATDFHPDGVGQRMNFNVVDSIISDLRCSKTICPDWKAPVENYFQQKSK